MSNMKLIVWEQFEKIACDKCDYCHLECALTPSDCFAWKQLETVAYDMEEYDVEFIESHIAT